MQKSLWTVFLFPMLAAAQPFGVGVKVGATLNNAISAVSTFSVPDVPTLKTVPQPRLYEYEHPVPPPALVVPYSVPFTLTSPDCGSSPSEPPRNR